MWVLDDIRVFVESFKDDTSQNIVRLQPVEGGTVHQVFGYTFPVISLAGKIVGEVDKSALKALERTGSSYTLSGNGTVYGSYYVSKATISQLYTISQTLRTDLDCSSPVFNFELELYKTTT